MRILLDYRPALRQRTGVGQYVHELASALLALLPRDDSLVLFSSSWKDRLPATVVPGAGRVDARVPVTVLNAAWHRLEWPPIEMLAGRADIAHSLHPLLMPARKAATVVTIHDLDFLDHPERTRAEIRRDYPSLAADHARRADLVVVNSHYTAAAVGNRLGVPEGRLAVVRPGAPADWAPRDPPDRVGPILFVGTVEPRKNIPALLSAYESIVRDRPDAPPLVLAGGRVEQSDAILEPASRGVLAGRVRYLGYVSHDERYALYCSASVVVVPSLEEGFGMTGLEAMHVGVPVVASNRGALPEVLGEAAIFADPLSPESIATAITRLLTDPGLAATHSSLGRARAQQFSWRDSAARLYDAYLEVLARRAADSP